MSSPDEAPTGGPLRPSLDEAPTGGPLRPSLDEAPSGSPDEVPAAEPRRWWRRPELGLALAVLVLGVLVVLGTLDVSTAASQLGPGPRFFPMLVGGAMILIGLCYMADVLRGGHGDPEESEDVDAEAPADWRGVALVSGIFLAFTAVLDVLGWIIAASLLFFALSLALGARHRLRAAGIAVVVGLTTYLLFVRGLGVTLPGGLLQGVI